MPPTAAVAAATACSSPAFGNAGAPSAANGRTAYPIAATSPSTGAFPHELNTTGT